MGLCEKGDMYGSLIYSSTQANEFYPTWHLKTQPEKDVLIALIKTRMEDQARVSHL
jgi:hypothetical protein